VSKTFPLNPFVTTTPKPSLTIREARWRRGAILVRGRVVGSRESRVTLRITLRGRRRALTRTLRIVNGAFAGTVRVPARARPRSVTASIRVTGARILTARRTIPAR
jgi:hypothetical protein